VIVCGGGVIGTSIAYYLAKRGQSCTIIDFCGIACAASGTAGAGLLRDVIPGAMPGHTAELTRVSFDLHRGLKEELGIDIGYR
jgi:glycine oxidase